MDIGVPKERQGENRVGLTPAAVKRLVEDGHRVLVETQAGVGAGYRDGVYQAAGGQTAGTDDVWACDLVVKVAPPGPDECGRLHDGQWLLGYMHLARSRRRTEALRKSGATVIALELVEDEEGQRPLMITAGQLAGQAAVREIVARLDKPDRMVVPWGATPGRLPQMVAVWGGGTAGLSAAWMALSLGVKVVLADTDETRRKKLQDQGLTALDPESREWFSALDEADGIVLAAGRAGWRAPRFMEESLSARREPGTVVVDLTVPDGGAISPGTLLPATVITTPNWPSLAASTASMAFSRQVLPLLRRMAFGGLKETFRQRPAWRKSVVVHEKEVWHPGVAAAHGLIAAKGPLGA